MQRSQSHHPYSNQLSQPPSMQQSASMHYNPGMNNAYHNPYGGNNGQRNSIPPNGISGINGPGVQPGGGPGSMDNRRHSQHVHEPTSD